MIKQLFYTLILILFCSFPVFGETYYVAHQGSGDGSACNNAKSLGWANANLTAGNTAILCDDNGDFTDYVINPANSGSEGGGYITYQGENASVTIDADDPDPSGIYGSPVDLRDGQSYIKVIDLTITHADNTDDGLIYIEGGNHIIFDNVTASLDATVARYGLVKLSNASYITILNSDLDGDQGARTEQHDLIYLVNSHHIFIYNTGLHTASHNSLSMPGNNDDSHHIVIKDCDVDNKWRSAITMLADVEWTLVDGCSIHGIGSDADNNPFAASTGDPGNTMRSGGDKSGPKIWRRSKVYDSYGPLTIYNSIRDSGASDLYNYFYNLTVYNMMDAGNEWYEGMFFTFDDDGDGKTASYNAIINCIFSTADPDSIDYVFRARHPTLTNNRVENNIIYDAETTGVRWGDATTHTVAWMNTNESQWSGNLTDQPTFVSAGTGNFTADDGDAPQVDAGQFLTTITSSSGTGTTFTVEDTRFFFSEAQWGLLDPDDNIQSDTIKTENGQTATISSINYGTNQITLTSAITWTQNEGIALNYIGNAPDIGAEEYSSPAPGNGIENPTPSNGATGQGLDVDISWTNGDDVTDTDIYFDDADCTTEVNNDGDTETSYEPGTLSYNTTYYWKVITEPDGANLSFPSTGCYTFSTINTPSDVAGLQQNSGGPAFIQNSGGLNWALSK